MFENILFHLVSIGILWNRQVRYLFSFQREKKLQTGKVPWQMQHEGEVEAPLFGAKYNWSQILALPLLWPWTDCLTPLILASVKKGGGEMEETIGRLKRKVQYLKCLEHSESSINEAEQDWNPRLLTTALSWLLTAYRVQMPAHKAGTLDYIMIWLICAQMPIDKYLHITEDHFIF